MARYLVLIALLAGCSSPPKPFVAGPEVTSSPQWIDYCRRHKEDVDCKT